MNDPVSTDDAKARSHFLLIGLVRIAGALVLLFGVAITMERFDWAQGATARWLGFAVSLVGLIDFFIVPVMMARAFSTRRRDQ